MPWSTWTRLVRKKSESFFFLPSVKTPDYHWPLWRPVFGRDTFSPLAQALGPLTKFWLCHPLRLFMGVSIIPPMWHLSKYCDRHLCLTYFEFLWLNQLVCTWYMLVMLICGQVLRESLFAPRHALGRSASKKYRVYGPDAGSKRVDLQVEESRLFAKTCSDEFHIVLSASLWLLRLLSQAVLVWQCHIYTYSLSGIRKGLSAPMADRPYLGFYSTSERTTKRVRCWYWTKSRYSNHAVYKTEGLSLCKTKRRTRAKTRSSL